MHTAAQRMPNDHLIEQPLRAAFEERVASAVAIVTSFLMAGLVACFPLPGTTAGSE